MSLKICSPSHRLSKLIVWKEFIFLSSRFSMNFLISNLAIKLLVTTPDSTTLNYWLNWRVLLCAIWIFTPMVVSVFIIWKHEDLGNLSSCREKNLQEIDHSLYEDRTWKPCLEQIHPIWLLAYRLIAFSVLLASLISKVSVNGFGMFYYYTQWTFTSVTIYFGFGLLLSISGCYQYHKMGKTVSNIHNVGNDTDQGYHVPLTYKERKNILSVRKFSNPEEETSDLRAASISSYLFQVLFQMNAGAVMLTDCVYWAIIFPFLTIKDYNLNFRFAACVISCASVFFPSLSLITIGRDLEGSISLSVGMTVNMHTLNVVVLLGDAALNCLPFPWFRMSYFILWTGIFVIFQWIFHACVSIWWPYPFLDLSSPYAPLWYLLIGLMHLPCYGVFVLIIKMKHSLLSKWFPQSYRCFP